MKQDLLAQEIVWKNKLKKNKKIFEYICEAMAELNSVFSVPALVVVTLRMISLSVGLYVVIYGVVSGNKFMKNIVPASFLFSIVGFLNTVTVFSAIDYPINQVNFLP